MGMEAINTAGEQVLNIMMTAGYWITLVAGAGQVINQIAKRDAQTALKQAFSYGVAFGALYLIRWILDLIKGVFGK
jgi:hypothetical protein